MIRLSAIGFLILAPSLSAHAENTSPILSHGPKAAADQILQAEAAFADEAARKGTAAAFRDFMDPKEGREFQAHGDPISGAAIFDAHKNDHGKLQWQPAEVFAAASGDMGLTWGRWTYAPASAQAKSSSGRYVTVWRKDSAGHWKAIIDIGNSDS